MNYKKLAEPCRNFNILGSTTMIDPKDGREKIVLSNFAAEALGQVIVIDSLTGVGESIQLPGDNGAWATLIWNNEKLLIGTCAEKGYLHCLDLKSRTWAEPLRHANETYIWNLTLGSDGMVYGGTYPGCLLLRYDPYHHVLSSMGRASEQSKNLYSRHVSGGVPGYIIISGGFDTPFLAAWNIETREMKQFAAPNSVKTIKEMTAQYICFAGGNNDERLFYDPITFEQLHDISLQGNEAASSRGLQLKDGRIAGVRGQDYYIVDKKGDPPRYQRIPVPAPATHIHTIISDVHGTIWGACGFGQTIFYYKPEDGTYWNSSVITNNGGEVYGMVFVDGKLYMSAYSGGDHVVYDPSESWDQLNNANPITLKSVLPELIRPTGRTVIGPDGGIWTGWSAQYGTYGGGLSRIDDRTKEVSMWYDPIPGQQVSGLTADDKYLYFTTNGGASGLAYNEALQCHLVVWSTQDSTIVHKQPFDKGIKLDAVLSVDGLVLVKAGNNIQIFDPETMTFVRTIDLGESCSWMVKTDPQCAVVFGERHAYRVNGQTGQFELLSELPGQVGTAAMTPDGEIYFAHGTVLYKLTK